MQRQFLIRVLINNKILRNKTTLHVRFSKNLQQRPELIQLIIDDTAFLEYGASIKVRLHCIISGISHQPRCSSCGNATKMRISGKYRYTFPNTCGSKCFSSDPRVIEKRKQTCLDRYGSTNYLTSASGLAARMRNPRDEGNTSK